MGVLLLGACSGDFVVTPDPDAGTAAPDLPVLTVQSPARGSFHPETVRLAGEVAPGDGKLVSLTLNDGAIAFEGEGRFDHELDPEHGMLLLGLRAEDDLGERAVDGRAVQVGPVHAPGRTIDDAMWLQLGPELLDDDAGDLDDMAAISEALLADPSFTDALVGQTFEGTVDITLTGLGLGGAAVDITPNAGVLWFDTTLEDVEATFTAGGVSGWMTAGAALLQMDLEVRAGAEGIMVEATWVDATIDDFRWGLDIGLEDLFADTVRGMVEESLEEAARDKIATLVGETLSSFALDMTLGEGENLRLVLEPSSASIVAEGVLISMDAGLGAEVPPDFELPDHAGSLATDGVAPSLPIVTDKPFVAAIDDDFLNQALFAYWHAGLLGGFELSGLELAAMTGEPLEPPLGPVDRARLDLLLPPLLLPETSGMDLDVAVGELQLRLYREDGEEVSTSLNVRAGADLVVGDGFSLAIDDRPSRMTVHAGMLAWPEVLDPGDLASLFRLATPSLLGRSSDLFPSFPAPALPIGALVDAEATEGLQWVAGDLRVSMTEGRWLLIEGRMTPAAR